MASHRLSFCGFYLHGGWYIEPYATSSYYCTKNDLNKTAFILARNQLILLRLPGGEQPLAYDRDRHFQLKVFNGVYCSLFVDWHFPDVLINQIPHADGRSHFVAMRRIIHCCAKQLLVSAISIQWVFYVVNLLIFGVPNMLQNDHFNTRLSEWLLQIKVNRGKQRCSLLSRVGKLS